MEPGDLQCHGEISNLPGTSTHRDVPVTGKRHLGVLKAALLGQLGLILLERPNVFQLCSHPNPGLAGKLQ